MDYIYQGSTQMWLCVLLLWMIMLWEIWGGIWVIWNCNKSSRRYWFPINQAPSHHSSHLNLQLYFAVCSHAFLSGSSLACAAMVHNCWRHLFVYVGWSGELFEALFLHFSLTFNKKLLSIRALSTKPFDVILLIFKAWPKQWTINKSLNDIFNLLCFLSLTFQTSNDCSIMHKS